MKMPSRVTEREVSVRRRNGCRCDGLDSFSQRWLNRKKPTPEPIALQRQLEQIRLTQAPQTELPESFWTAAVELARHTVFIRSRTRSGSAIWVDEAAEQPAQRTAKRSQASIHGLVARPVTMPECVIDF
jgi:hypothetical protein